MASRGLGGRSTRTSSVNLTPSPVLQIEVMTLILLHTSLPGLFYYYFKGKRRTSTRPIVYQVRCS